MVAVTPITAVITGTNSQPLTAGGSSNLTMTVNTIAALVNISQVVTTIVVVEFDMTSTETKLGTAVMLITLARDALVLALAHALVAVINLQVDLEVDHAVPAVNTLES